MPADPRPAWRRILPIVAIALATLIALAAISEGTARLLLSETPASSMHCLIAGDTSTGVRGIPNSHCQQKAYESALTDYRFNACGFRTPQPCGPAPAGTYRIVMVGSSTPFGSYVQQEESFAARLGPFLSKRLGRPVEVFNEAMLWGMPSGVALRTDAMLAPKPDMILWALTPFDLANVRLVIPDYAKPLAARAKPTTPPASQTLATLPSRTWKTISSDSENFRSVLLLRHLLYRNQDEYLVHAVGRGAQADYLRVPTPPALEENLKIFAQLLAKVSARAQAAGVPLAVTLVPSRPQAIMLSGHKWDSNFDPSLLDRRLAQIAKVQGDAYVDMTSGLADVRDAGRAFFPVDEHLRPEGHAMMAKLLGDALLRSGPLATPTSVPEQAR